MEASKIQSPPPVRLYSDPQQIFEQDSLDEVYENS